MAGKGKQFTSEYQPRRNGRRKKIVNVLNRDYHLSIDDARAVVSYALTSPLSELKDRTQDETTPTYMLAVIASIRQLIKKGSMADFISAVEFQDRKGTRDMYDLSNLSDEALLKIAEIIQNDRKDREQIADR